MMPEFSMADWSRRYSYIHDCNWPSEAIDVHHIVVRKSNAKGFFLCLSAFILLTNASCLFLVKNASMSIFFWSFLLSAILLKLMFWKPVVKGEGSYYSEALFYHKFRMYDSIVCSECVPLISEKRHIFIIYLVVCWNGSESVTVMPAFGVQLETHYRSGRIVRQFVPIDKILKPVLVECATQLTCYWSLSLILRGEAELMLVFKELRPPVKMQVPIWKALCIASSSGENSKDA